MKTKVKVAYSVTHVTTVTVTLTDGDITIVRSAKCASARITETIQSLRATAIEQHAVVERALA